MRLVAKSYIHFNDSSINAGDVFEAAGEQAQALLDNGAAVVYTEGVYEEGSAGAADDAPPAAPLAEGTPE